MGTTQIVGFAKELTIIFENSVHVPEHVYIEASGKRLCKILAQLEAQRLKEHPDVHMVLISAEYFTITKEFQNQG